MDDLVTPKAIEITYETDEPILYEVADGVAWITMNRPGFNNAQNGQMTYALDDAFQRATNDDAVKCIVLAGNGKHFSAGHDIGTPGRDLHHEFDKRLMFAPHTNKPAAELLYTREQEQYLGMCRRWRDVPKPTIAMVQGACVAGGLMLAWACDVIVASEDAQFCDPVVTMGVCGVEWFVHPWELGPRKAKELLFTADSWSAREAESFGMVNRVYPRETLAQSVMEMARKIAAKPSFALKMTKEAVNRSVDLMGQQSGIDQAFGLHQLCHAHNMLQFGTGIDPMGMPGAVANKPVKA